MHTYQITGRDATVHIVHADDVLIPQDSTYPITLQIDHETVAVFPMGTVAAIVRMEPLNSDDGQPCEDDGYATENAECETSIDPVSAGSITVVVKADTSEIDAAFDRIEQRVMKISHCLRSPYLS